MAPDPEQALILRPGALGDTLLLAPALQSLAGRAGVTVVGRLPGLFLLRSCTAHCIDFEGGGWHHLFEAFPATGLPVIRPSPHWVAAFIMDADGRVERNLEALFPESAVGVFPGVPPVEGPVHAARYLAERLARLGMEIDPEACLDRARKAPVLPAGKPTGKEAPVVLHPGSGGRRKNFSPAFWQELMQAFWEASGKAEADRVTLLLGPAEHELRETFEGAIQENKARMVHSPPMGALASLLGRARLYVGHDSGVTHLAAMLGAPTVALFRETDPHVWGPLGPRVQVISGERTRGTLVEATVRAAKELEWPLW